MTHVNPQWPEEGWDESDAYSLECGCDSDQQDHTCGTSADEWNHEDGRERR